MEGALAPVACLADEINECSRCDTCQTLGFWKGLQNTIDKYVDSVTLRDLM
jgi:DNA-binding IscR family transcriptional regulator